MKDKGCQYQLGYIPMSTETGDSSGSNDCNEHRQYGILDCQEIGLQKNLQTFTGNQEFNSLQKSTCHFGDKEESLHLADVAQEAPEGTVSGHMTACMNNEVDDKNTLTKTGKYKKRRHENGHLLLQHSFSSSLRRYCDILGRKPDQVSSLEYKKIHYCDTSKDRVQISGNLLELDSNIGNKPTSAEASLVSSYQNNLTEEESSDGCPASLSRKSTQNLNAQQEHHATVDLNDLKSDLNISLNLKVVSNANQTKYIGRNTTPVLNEVETILHHLLECSASPKKKAETSIELTLNDPQKLPHDKHTVGSRSSVYKDHPAPKKLYSTLENKERTSRKTDKSLSESVCAKYSSCRWKLAYLCFLARFAQTSLRQCLGVAVIGMTLAINVEGGEHSSASAQNNASEIVMSRQIREFQWSSTFEGVILASFNMGSIITPIIVGYLTTRHGGRKLMTLCLAVGGVFTVMLPVAARTSPALIIVLRIITGIALSGTDSLIQTMWARWAPLYEKASLSACAYTGLSTAGVLTFLICGYLVSIGGEGRGWPYIFYTFGILCLLLAPIWYFTVHDSPESHPRITKKELAIIAFNKQPEKFRCDKQELNTPWKRIFKSSAVWVIVMGHITHKWILSFMLSYLPRYFSDLFHFDLKMDGLFSSLPFAGRIVAGAAAGYMSDWMLRKGISTERTRKFFQATGCWGCAVCSLLIAFIPNLSNVWSISLLVLALSCQDLTSVAFRINLLDIAPRYAGLLNGVVSTIATLTSLPAPVITSLLISGGSQQGWQVVFSLVAGLNIIGGIIFVMFAKGEVQDWAQDASLKQTMVKTKEEMDIFALDTHKEARSKEYDNMALREVKSLPAGTSESGTQQKVKASRRATLDIGAMIKSVRSHAFTNLALADL